MSQLLRRGSLSRRLAGVATFVTLLLVTVAGASAAGTGMSFTTLGAGYTQEIVGTYPGVMCQPVFASNGDPMVSVGGGLVRFDRSTTLPPVGGTTTLHPYTAFTAPVACGVVAHPNGHYYSNTGNGVYEFDVSGTSATPGTPFGGGGSGLGIAVDPVTGDLVYVAAGGTILSAPVGEASTTFATPAAAAAFDQITFDPTGQFLFAADNAGNAVYVLGRPGTGFERRIPMADPVGPDGIAVSTTSPRFVLVNGNDGTIRRLDFAGGDFSQEPTVSTFASGGFRGDMSSVGPDGCLYVSQNGARFDDLTVSGENSVVRLCAEDGGGFSPPGCPLPVSSPADTCVTAEVVSTITVTAPALVAFPPLAVGGTSPLVAAPVNVKSNGGGYQLSVTRTVFTRGDIPLSIELGASADADQISDLAGASPIPTSGNLNIGHRTGSITPAGGDTWATSMRLGPVPPVASGTHASIVTFTAVAF